MIQTYRFPINAVLNDAPNGFIEFRRDHGVYVKRVGDAKARHIFARNLPHDPVPEEQEVSKVIDIRGVKENVTVLDDVRFLCVSIDERQKTVVTLDT
jgi:hypothetical protein